MEAKVQYIAEGAATGDVLFTGKDETALIRQINAAFPLPARGFAKGQLLPEPIWLYAIDSETGKRI